MATDVNLYPGADMRLRIPFFLALVCAIIFAGLVISLLEFSSVYARYPLGGFFAGWGIMLFLPLVALFATLALQNPSPVQRWARRLGVISALLGFAWGPVAYRTAGNLSLRFQSGFWFHAMIIWIFAILIASLMTVVLYVVGWRTRAAGTFPTGAGPGT